MDGPLRRDGVTWLAYLMLALYGYFLNAFGPITPFLKAELQLTYTHSSLHFTAFAAGILLVGLGGHLIVARIGRWRALWTGALGLSVGSALLLLGKHAFVTIGASFLMGLIGSLILIIVQSTLTDRHGEQRAAAISEANVTASLFSALAPLMVGWFALSAAGWRAGLALAAFAPLLLYPIFSRFKLAPSEEIPAEAQAGSRRLPAIFWAYWAAVLTVVSVEFCMVYWSADYLEGVLGLSRPAAAQSVSLFLAAMILGRLAGSRLVQRMPIRRVIGVSILLAVGGFALFWLPDTPWLAQVGLFLTGLGVASLYPLNLSLAMGASGGQTVLAGARTTLASGFAILLLPLALGRLEDSFGIRPAYALVPGLLIIAMALIQATARATAKIPVIRPG